MKHLILTLFLILISISIYSQSHFQVVLGDENKYANILTTIQNNENEHILYGGVGMETTGGYIVRLSEEGEVLQEKFNFIPDSTVFIANIIQQENNNYLLTSVIRASPNYQTNNFIVLSDTDENFNT